MSISTHVDTFAGKTVLDWDSNVGILDPDRFIYRISVEYGDEEEWTDVFAEFLDDPGASATTALVVGAWDFENQTREEVERIIEALVAAREQLPNLTALFLGDITFEENEISWIQQSDVAPLFEAYPQLEQFRVRGGEGLHFGRLHHERLQSLIVETGGLSREVVQDILNSHVPALTHLELWLGDENYGATTTVADLEPLFSGQLFPQLRYLGLRDSQISNEIAQRLSQSPLLDRIRVLDLSLGLLDDEGAQFLLDCPAVHKLEKLDIHHHYCSQEMVAQLETLDIELDASDRQESEEDDGEVYRYIAVSE